MLMTGRSSASRLRVQGCLRWRNTTAVSGQSFLKSHSWPEYARWHLGLTGAAQDETKARYAFVCGDFHRLRRMGIIACQYRAAEWRYKDIEFAAHDLLQRLDARHS